MATFTFTGMRASLPRVAPFTATKPQKLSLPAFSGLRLSKGLPLQSAGTTFPRCHIVSPPCNH